MKDKVSYIIVTWNNADIISDCISSLEKYCSLTKNEIIIVDNNSSDNTCSVISNNFKYVHLISLKENLGFSKANNIGLKQTTGDYIFFINPDVIFIENIVTPMINVLENNGEVGVVAPRLLYKNLDFQKSVGNFPCASQVFWNELHFSIFLTNNLKNKYAQVYSKSKKNRYVDWAYGAALLCRATEVKKIGGFPENYFMYGEDTEICMRFFNQLKKKTFYLYDTKLIHLGGYSENKVVNSKKVEYVMFGSMNFVKKYYGISALKRYKNIYIFSSVLRYLIFSILYLMTQENKFKNKKNKMRATVRALIKYREENC